MGAITGAGLFDGDICVVDRSLKPADRSVIVALVDGAFTMKRLRMRGGRVWLQAENPDYPDIPVIDGTAFEVWGVVPKAVRMLVP